MKTRFDFGRFRCAIFDLDGTLLNSTDVWAKVDIDFLGKRNIEVPEDFIRKIKTHNFATGSKYVIDLILTRNRKILQKSGLIWLYRHMLMI